MNPNPLYYRTIHGKNVSMSDVLKMSKEQICREFPPYKQSEGGMTEHIMIVNVRTSLKIEHKSLYDATREKWKIRKKSDDILLASGRISYIIPVYNGLILEIYDTNGSHVKDPVDGRWTLNGITPATSMSHLIGTHLNSTKKPDGTMLLPGQLHSPVII